MAATAQGSFNSGGGVPEPSKRGSRRHAVLRCSFPRLQPWRAEFNHSHCGTPPGGVRGRVSRGRVGRRGVSGRGVSRGVSIGEVIRGEVSVGEVSRGGVSGGGVSRGGVSGGGVSGGPAFDPEMSLR